MKNFREQIAADNTAAFINSLEFAEEHSLNGTVCNAILQDISVAESLSTGAGSTSNLSWDIRQPAAGKLLGRGFAGTSCIWTAFRHR